MSNFTETTRVGFSARIKNAVKGIGLGIAFVGLSVSRLFWNEGNAVRTAGAWTDSPKTGKDFRISAGHMNPPMPIRSTVLRHDAGKIGGFTVTEGVGDLGGSDPMFLTADQAQTIGAALGLGRDVRLTAGVVQTSEALEVPHMGDLRISYFVSDIDRASVVGAQHDGALIPYIAKNGRNVFLIEEGLKPADAMLKTAQDAKRFKTWGLRGLLIGVMFLGFKALLSIIDVVASFIPLFGWLTSSVTSLVSLALTSVVGGGSIAIAWLSVWPMLSAAILAAGAIAAGIVARRKARAPAPQAA